MEERQRGVSLSACCAGILVLSLWLQTTASGTVPRVDSADDVRLLHGRAPCGEDCNSQNKLITKDDHHDDGGGHSIPLHLRLLFQPKHLPRAKRQTVVVEVNEGSTHRVACTRAEERKAACLKGKCYALDMGQLRNPFCECPAKYEGPRCEMLSAYYFTNYYAELKKGALIGGLVVGIILLIVAISVYCSYRKGRKRDKPLCCCGKRSAATSSKNKESDAMMTDHTSNDIADGNHDSKV